MKIRPSYVELVFAILFSLFSLLVCRAANIESVVLTDALRAKYLQEYHNLDKFVWEMLTVMDEQQKRLAIMNKQHRAMKPVTQETQHLAALARPEQFLKVYAQTSAQIKSILRNHQVLEHSIGEKKITDQQAMKGFLKWRADSDAMEGPVKLLMTQFDQIGKEYLQIFADHNALPPELLPKGKP